VDRVSNHSPTTVLACGELRGGNEPVFSEVELPGLRGVLFSNPCVGASGGDVHYLSVCGSGLLSRVCLADVAGHGETIAAVGREMHELLRRSVNIVDERRVLSALDDRLDESGVKALTTAAILSYYPSSRRLTVSYAGHPPGWIFRREAKTWERLSGEEPTGNAGLVGLPLGTGLAPSYTRRRLKAFPGDRLLLVTDGVLEAPAPDGDEFGASRVEALLTTHRGTPAELANRLLEALRSHTAAASLAHDDVTFFAGQFVSGPPGPVIWSVVKNRLLRRLVARTPAPSVGNW
jgi:sigma-B regulation protein RsbU (phosphoserine phosphatase)